MRRIAGWLATQNARSWLVGLILAASIAGLLGQWQQQRDWQARFLAQQRAEQKAAAKTIRKVCAGFGELAAEKPPAGNPAQNPSRAFEQGQHTVLVGIGADLGCKPSHTTRSK